jgi:tRNA A-37 threonylcarbamoyl transferase component Bud32
MHNHVSITKLEYSPLTTKQKHLYSLTSSSLILLGTGATIYGALNFSAFAFNIGNPFLLLFAVLLFLALTMTIFTTILTIRNALKNPTQPLIITSGGLIFPVGASIQLRGRRWRQWSEVKSVWAKWEEHEGIQEQDHLLLEFNDGCKTTVPLKSMKTKDLEQLLVAIDMNLSSSLQSVVNNLADLRNYLSITLKNQGIPSYTALWNDELSRRFNLATFRPLAPGSKLQNGHYEITSQLRFGGFSAVYHGIGRHGDRVVIKELAIDHLENEDVKLSLTEHLKREANILAKLDHPRICHMLDTFMENGRHYIVLEKIPGSNLRQIVNENGPFKEADVKKLALQMTGILGYLHHREPPLIHRDFTPDNLIAKENGNLILIDFNAATELLSGVTSTIIGKHHYMPPEQIKGKAVPQSDYYSMAGTMAFLLSSKDPVPLMQINLKEQGLAISPTLNDLMYSLTNPEAEARPSLDDINSHLH